MIFIGLPVMTLVAAWAAWNTRSPAKAAFGAWVSTSVLALFLSLMMAVGTMAPSLMTHTNEQFPVPIGQRLGQLCLLGMTLLIPFWVYRHKSRLKSSVSAEDDHG